MDIRRIQTNILAKDYRFSDHAIKRMIDRCIRRPETEKAILNGKIIEEYQDDKYSPSCLIFGKTESGRPLHVLVSLPPDVVVITAYEPDSAEWEDYQKRR